MSIDRAVLAQRRLVQAFYLDGTLAVFATGILPSPGYEVSVEKAVPGADPPHFSLLLRRLAGIYPTGEAPFTISRLFAAAACPRQIVVFHDQGRDLVDVVDILRDSITLPPGLGDLPIPYVFPPSAVGGATADVAIGYSQDLRFSEALREALSALSPADAAAAEYPQVITVTEIGVEQGGIANFRHLFVRVRREPAGPGRS